MRIRITQLATGLALAAAIGTATPAAHAASVNHWVTPDNPAVDVTGNATLTAVQDNDARGGYEGWAWEADTPGGANYVRFTPIWENLPTGTTVADIARISYWTNAPEDHPSLNWFFNIYTFAEGDGLDSAGWYRSALTAEPYYADNANAPADQWSLWSTDNGTNQLTLFDRNRHHFPYDGATLEELGDGATSWGWDYADELVRGIQFGVGDTGAGWDASGLRLDGIEIELVDGTTLTHNLVPLPAAAWAGLALLGAMGGVTGVKRKLRRN